jgi:hypothetical protein
MKEAVAIFYENAKVFNAIHDGRMSNWSDNRRREVSKGITLAATGYSPQKGNPCFSISDCGEGQTPEMMPPTLLSLNRSNKLRIPFVQGKFNMGGTGVLQFCGRNNLQLILSKRNPNILALDGKLAQNDDHWGFSVVRRENPEGSRRNSVYTYLAPIETDGRHGRILSFASDCMPLFPELNEPYAREAAYGTLIKLYEYEAPGFRSHILMRDGLLSRTNLLLPDIALPVRFHECRPNYRGHKGSYDTTVTGLTVRLDDDKAENIEPGFPDTSDERQLLLRPSAD